MGGSERLEPRDQRLLCVIVRPGKARHVDLHQRYAAIPEPIRGVGQARIQHPAERAPVCREIDDFDSRVCCRRKAEGDERGRC